MVIPDYSFCSQLQADKG